MIPDFKPEEVWPEKEDVPYRILPNATHESDLDELRSHFVDSFPCSSTRLELFEKFLRLHSDTHEHGIRFCQWITGSFITSKEHPDDVDAMTLVHRDEANGLSVKAVHFMYGVLNGKDSTKSEYGTHAFFRLYFPPDDPRHDAQLESLLDWRKFWGKTRKLKADVTFQDGTTVKKGEECPRGIICVRNEDEFVIPSF